MDALGVSKAGDLFWGETNRKNGTNGWFPFSPFGFLKGIPATFGGVSEPLVKMKSGGCRFHAV